MPIEIVPRYRPPTVTLENGDHCITKMERHPKGPFVDIVYLTRSNRSLTEAEHKVKKLEAELKRLQDLWETRDLLEVAVMEKTTKMVEDALGTTSTTLKLIAKP